MIPSVIEYFSQLPVAMHFVPVQELSDKGSTLYRMLSDYGTGTFKIIRFQSDLLLILIADFTPKGTFEKVTRISEDYLELSQFETDSSSFKVGGRKVNQVEKGILFYINTHKTTYTYCEGGKPTRFAKIIITKKYFDTYFQMHHGNSYDQSKYAQNYIAKNPNLPELNFVFQQIQGCKAEGRTLHLYLESKIMELLSLSFIESDTLHKHLPVRIDRQDIRNLKKTVTFMKKDLAAYPTGKELAHLANMSPTRYQLAFRKHYGTTPYEYLKEMRLNQALLLLKNSDYSVSIIADKVGYHNSGHFANLFRTAYGLSPREYRKIYGKYF